MVTPSPPLGASTAAGMGREIQIPAATIVVPNAVTPASIRRSQNGNRERGTGNSVPLSGRLRFLAALGMTKAVIPSRQARDRDRPDRGLLFPVPSSLFPLAPLTLPSPRTCPRHFGHSRQGCTSPPVSYTHLRAHETPEHLVCRL